MYDVVIIGGGVIGCAIAKVLSHKECKVALLEKENDIANGITMANSAIIHSGHDPKTGTLKELLNRRGSELYPLWAKEVGFEYKNCGGLVVAKKDQVDDLHDLYKQTLERGIPCTLLTREEVLLKESNVSDEIIAACALPSTSIVYPWEVAINCMEFAMNNGVELFLNNEVQSITYEGSYFITTSKQTLQSKIVINATGCNGDVLRSMLVKESNLLYFVKGEYFVLDYAKNPIVSQVIYPMPSSKGKGILVVPTVSNNVLLGPTANEVDSSSTTTSRSGLQEIRQKVAENVKNIPFENVIRSFGGVRPKSKTSDFIIQEEPNFPGFIQVIGIDSPGLASAPAIGEYVVRMLPNFSEKETMISRRKTISLRHKSTEEKNELIKENPLYGSIVCRCEKVSKQEIIDCINRNAGARSVKAIKKRVRPGLGRCQGGFCEGLIVELLAETLHINPCEVVYDQEDTFIIKEVL